MKSFAFFLGMVVAVLLLTGAPTMTSAQCNIQNLALCLQAVTTPALPTRACCQRLIQQRTCFCGYLKDPIFKRYYNPSVARKISNACKIPIPRCP